MPVPEPRVVHLIATVNPDEIVAWSEIGQRKRSGAEYSLSGSGSTRLSEPATAAANGNGYPRRQSCFSAVDGELFHLFREFPQADDIRLHANVFSLILRKISDIDCPDNCYDQVRDSYRHRECPAPSRVIHRVTLHCQRLLLRLVATVTKNRLLRSCLLRYFHAVLFSLNGQKRRR